MKYLPDLEKQRKMPDREFCFRVVNALKPGFITGAFEHSYKLRDAKLAAKRKVEDITINDHWLQELEELPFDSSK